jgi:hypothetical protein
MTLKSTKYLALKTRLRTKYQRTLKQVLKDLKKESSSEISSWVLKHRTDLTTFSNLNCYFLSLLKTYASLAGEKVLSHEFGVREERVFETWNQSEFAESFLRELNRGSSLEKASRKTLKVFDRHLVVFGERHLLKNDKRDKAYRLQPSLGEYQKNSRIVRELETMLHLEGKELKLMTKSLQEMKNFSQRIEIALKVIRKFSPSSWERFVAFTDTIVPISQKEFVSYSHQDLPGVSMINLYDRDFVDLMDDLLHENGHHHLNYYLNLGKLIDEPVEQIYYSPWRRTLRPLRGLFHAYFTFFWAFKLFSDLARAKDMDSIWYLFSKDEKEKIHWRAVEEYHMLNYAYQELKWAKKNGLIREKGWELILEQNREVRKFKKHILRWEKKMPSFGKELSSLKKNLKEAQKVYLK